MALPYFYVADLTADTITLDEDTSKHIVQVLRMQQNEEVLLTNGKGTKARCTIVDDNRKRCTVKLVSVEQEEQATCHVTIAISLVKNASRFEWFLEKATEIGVRQIIPLVCERTEKEKFRYDRIQNIVISAMLQSQQCWLPHLHQPTNLDQVIKESTSENKWIAHCIPQQKRRLPCSVIATDTIILIGPEGDFTEKEISSALQHGFQPVSLGKTRLRTETAGIVAAALLCNR